MPRTPPKLTPRAAPKKKKQEPRKPAINLQPKPQRSPDKTPIWWEQARQAILSESVKAAEARIQEKLSAKAQDINQRKIELSVLEHELMMGVVGLDWQIFPKEKLEVIKAAYVVNGTMESGNSRLLIPKEGSGEAAAGTYTALFNRLALSPAPAEPPHDPSQEVFDLIPPPKALEVPKGQKNAAIPPPGESIDEAEKKPDPDSNIIHVEIE